MYAQDADHAAVDKHAAAVAAEPDGTVGVHSLASSAFSLRIARSEGRTHGANLRSRSALV